MDVLLLDVLLVDDAVDDLLISMNSLVLANKWDCSLVHDWRLLIVLKQVSIWSSSARHSRLIGGRSQWASCAVVGDACRVSLTCSAESDTLSLCETAGGRE